MSLDLDIGKFRAIPHHVTAPLAVSGKDTCYNLYLKVGFESIKQIVYLLFDVPIEILFV